MVWGMLASVVAMRPTDAAESYSRWKIERIIEIAIQYVADTKTEFARRAAAIEAETGEVVELDYQYFHEPTGAEQRKQEKFAAAKISDALAEKHIRGFLADLERVRKKLAEAEKELARLKAAAQRMAAAAKAAGRKGSSASAPKPGRKGAQQSKSNAQASKSSGKGQGQANGQGGEDDITLDDIRATERNRQPPDEGIMCELLWSDPQPMPGRSPYSVRMSRATA